MSIHASLGSLRVCIWPSNVSSAQLTTVRHASLNSAIGRGIRKSRGLDNSPPSRNPTNDNNSRNGQKGSWSRNHTDYDDRRDTRSDVDEFVRSGNFRERVGERQHPSWMKRGRMDKDETLKKLSRAKKREPRHKWSEKMPERVKDHVFVPKSIPYTTPASEFIYGTNAVESTLRCSRRKIYKLYIYQNKGEELGPAKLMLRKLALVKNIPVKLAFAEWDRLLDKMSSGRPHNGCVLEVSPLPRLPVQSLAPVPSPEEDFFRVELGSQSREEALINGTSNRIEIHQPVQQEHRRYPVTLLLDGIVDQGNLGAIIRSAYYLGIDAIVFAGRNSAPLSDVTIKASAGASENMTLLEVSNERAFIQQSKTNGWRFYAADVPGPGSTLEGQHDANPTSGGSRLTQGPSVIMMGSESSGLSRHFMSHANAIVSIPGSRFVGDSSVESDPARVDSLNVSVAAALLMEKFLRTPLAVTEIPQEG
ncbi:TrmH family RNA methyltransferase [Aspergillus chevalieri]|uniref:rRNA methyltransferase 1, mitochondrial n=1 Tax=Aspergillus chevalieri TaxID=182096 RepID=A0A7R7VDW3_ASPCH|nr:uncharacterized protein ACHE_10399S [Aspergillus chevalieri]BCR82996.1 hypothetical protein ACHE_10399S [Aspergillus chevalieri]